jgi:preprotein translocase subunit SecD
MINLKQPKTMFAIVLAVVALTFLSVFDVKTTQFKAPRLGLDLRGGIRLTLQAEPTKDVPKITHQVMESLLGVIERRVNALGVSESVVQRVGQDRLLVEIPGVSDPEQAKKMLGKVGNLSFKIYAGKDGKTLVESGVSGKDLASAEAVPDPQNPTGWQVHFTLNAQGTDRFGNLTAKLAPKKEPIAIVFDDNLISAPSVKEPILEGSGTISGNFDKAEAKDLASLLNAGALPVSVSLIEENAVGPLLGMASLQQSLHAGLIGLGLVLLFMAGYYRTYGILAGIALLLYAFFSYALFMAMGVTFTLAGIAGSILSVGMAVDANILIFERLKEERASGRRLDHAIESGFSRAFPSIFDSNMTTLITCALLYWLGTGAIKGFAVTLAAGVAVSLFTSLFVTRSLMGLYHEKDMTPQSLRDDYRARV